MLLELVDPALDAAAAQESRADQQPLEAGCDQLRADPGIGDRAGADRTRCPRTDCGLEHGAADVDVAGVALLGADLLVVDRDDALLGMGHAAELVLVDDLDERSEAVAEG